MTGFDPLTGCLACWLIQQMGYLPTPSPAHFDFSEFVHDHSRPGHVDYSAVAQ